MPSTTPSAPPERRGRGVTAVLGPTNTGKTHLAIDRMLAHSSGVIGLPLRLLAREVYNRAVERVGAESVALITGEEKIKPANPRFWVCTVEAMPRDLDVAFVAVDEVQIAGDLERGHVFTDRMFNRRGREETLILGAATVRPLVQRLLPGVDVIQRPRLSQLTFAGEKKITRLPRRSAIVAFSAEEVYAIAELIRRQRGGAAVVLGALSPRTRNAQVELYQSGEVDYIVATDAIGMGLNLDVDHVAFASDRKFDGYQFRRLNAAEMAQIAGRAGRATRDGTFGTTGRCPAFEIELVERLEGHSFEPVVVLQWRNTDLDFRSIAALLESLAEVPDEEGLTRAPIADDVRVLERAARDDDVIKLATDRRTVELLWEACQIPDYRKIAPAAHAELILTLFGFLARSGKIPPDWFARQVAQADRTDGDIDTLSYRIAQVRTWTFAANRADWLEDPEHWQGVTRAVEDKLSDALHERLTQRFVDRRTSVLMRRLRENAMLETEITKTGDVVVEGHVIGHLSGFEFAPASSAGEQDAKALRAAAQKALAGEIESRAKHLAEAGDEAFVLASDGTIRWTGEPVARLVAGENLLEPRLRVLADEQLTGAARDSVDARLVRWLGAHVEKLLGPLVTLGKAEDIAGIGRGVAFQIVEALGVLERQRVAEEVKSLDQDARASLRKYGVRFGAYHIYLPALLKPAPRALGLMLYGLKHGGLGQHGLDTLPALAASGRTSIAVDEAVAKPLYRIAGYRVCGPRALRVDILERLADQIRPALAWRPGAPSAKPAGALDGRGFVVTVGMTSLAGCAGEEFAAVLRALGYRMERRPAPPPEPVPSAAAPAAEAAAEPTTIALAEAVATEGPAVQKPPQEISAPSVAPIAEETVEAAPGESTFEPAPETAAPAPEIVAPSEPPMIEVWRPGRPDRAPRKREERRPRTDRPAAIQTAPVETTKPAEEPRREVRQPRRDERPRRETNERPRHQRKDRPRREGSDWRRDLPAERKERAADPNSPFAALAVLKARLEANKKGE
jgi:ATP-dependent RNA helicase SUPV3L1/SUV3